MADGLVLLLTPRLVIRHANEVLALAPNVRVWEGMGAVLGLCLLAGTRGLRYEMLWTITGFAMMLKGGFLLAGPARWRQDVLSWCFRREDVDYRFWGLGLCTLALLLLQASGWVGST